MRRVLLAGWLLAGAACGEPRAEAPRRVEPPPPSTPLDALPLERLRLGLDARPGLAVSDRNPFQFGRTGTRAPRAPAPPLPSAEGLPELPLPLAQPPMRLLGVSKLADGSRVASISLGKDLILARDGDLIAGRFRVTRVDDDAVEMTDALGDQPLRLALP